MVKNVYLHIGLTKTGSSSIQTSLRLNKKKLEEQGYYYLDFSSRSGYFSDVTGEFKNISLASIAYYFHIINYPKEILPYYSKQLVSRVEELEPFDVALTKILSDKDNADSMIVSGEGIRIEALSRLLTFFKKANMKVKAVVIYVRRQDQHIDSLMNQLMKQGVDVKHEYLAPYVHNDLEKLTIDIRDTLSEFSCEDVLHIRNYDLIARNSPSSLLQDFYKCMGISDFSEFMMVDFKSNSSLSAESLFLLRQYADRYDINGDKVHYDKYRALRQFFDRKNNKLPGNKLVFFDDESRQQLLNDINTKNSRIFDEFDMGKEEKFEQWMSFEKNADNTVLFDSFNTENKELVNRSIIMLEEQLISVIQKDFILLTQNILKIIKLLPDKKIFIYGGGIHTINLLNCFNGEYSFCGVIDTSPSGKTVLGIPLYKSSEFDYSKADLVIISSKAFEGDIYQYLKTRMSEQKIITLYDSF